MPLWWAFCSVANNENVKKNRDQAKIQDPTLSLVQGALHSERLSFQNSPHGPKNEWLNVSVDMTEEDKKDKGQYGDAFPVLVDVVL